MHLYMENFLYPTNNYTINAYHMAQPAMEKINQELQQPRIDVENKEQQHPKSHIVILTNKG